MKHRPWIGYLLAALGVAVLLFSLALHFYSYFGGAKYELNYPVIYVGMLIGFVGFYMINPKGAEGGTNILTRTVVAIISVVRSGKSAASATTTVEVTPVHDGVADKSATTTVVVPAAIPPVTPTKTDDESGK